MKMPEPRNLTKSDEEYVADLNRLLREMREESRKAEEAGLVVRLRTRPQGNPGVIQDTMLAIHKVLAGGTEDPQD